jgi:hypothetical protein
LTDKTVSPHLPWTIAKGDAEAAQTMAADPKRFWNLRGHLRERRVWLRQASTNALPECG